MSDHETYSRLGHLESKVENQADILREVKATVESVEKQTNEIKITLARNEGGKKALFGLLTAAGVLGALMDKFITWLKLPLP